MELNAIYPALDLTGNTNLSEIRAAFNYNMTNIVLASTNPVLWHFCIHDCDLGEDIDFAKFPSLKEPWVWGSHRQGVVTFNSTNLTKVEMFENQLASADLRGQLNMEHVFIENNQLTNLNIAGCSNVIIVRAYSNSLPTAAVDSVLTNLDNMGLAGVGGQVLVDRGNNGVPSSAGFAAVSHLRAKGWFVAVNNPNGPIISDVAVDAGSNSATVTWTTDVSSDSVVSYGTNSSYGFSASGNSNTTHTVSLGGLTTNTIYHFAVSSTSSTNTSTSADGTFLTLGGNQNTNPIYFVSTSTTVSMLASNSTSAAVTWYWGDGTTNTSSSHTFGSAGTYTNYVIINPPSAVIGFGAACQGSANTTLSSISGLSNYPNLQGLFAISNRPCKSQFGRMFKPCLSGTGHNESKPIHGRPMVY